LGKKNVDALAKTVFEQIQELEASLVLPASSSQAARSQLRDSRRRLQNFKREAAKAAEDGRKTGDPTEMQKIADRLTKGFDEPTPKANLEGPRREIPAGATMELILKDILQGNN